MRGLHLRAVEGTRPVLLEVEALVSETSFGTPRRMASGVDYNRVSLIIAVLEKKIGLKLYNQDVFVNVSGGIRIAEPALDLAIAVSIVSSFRNRPVRRGSVFGRDRLDGRDAAYLSDRKEDYGSGAHGLTRLILPDSNCKGIGRDGLEFKGVHTLFDALAIAFEAEK